jgi:DNA-binding NtrC family response regulator
MGAAKAVLEEATEARVLVASSSSAFRERMVQRLAPRSSRAEEATGGADALNKLESARYQTLYLDCRLEDLDFNEVLQMIQSRHPQVRVVSVDSGGDPSESLSKASGKAKLAEDSSVAGDDGGALQAGIPSAQSPAVCRAPVDPLPGMIGRGTRMARLYRLARLVAPRDTAVLIIGGTGTGKELVARGIHQLSPRSQRSFIVVNCAAIPESLLEAELFGYTRGAFTGAFQSRLGRIHAAHGGTLLLDEIGELPLTVQAKLLRFVQEGEVQRLGSTDLFRVDVRMIAATNANLLQRVKEKQFREDLYYRLNVFPLELPLLKHRADDILALAEDFLAALSRQANVPVKRISPEAAHLLRQHSWPGNVRELQHLVERAFVLAEDRVEITADLLSLPLEAV